MKTGDKVLVITGMEANSRIIMEGIAGVVEENFVWIGGVPYARMFTILDTGKNRFAYREHCQRMKEWESQKPNMFVVLNEMDK